MRKCIDIAVCGCGPAGLAAALLLHRAGHRVRIFERFAAAGPVGSGLILQPTGLGVLAELGLASRLVHLGARIERLFGRVVPSGRVVLDVRYRAMGPDWSALAVHRAALFETLLSAVDREGIEVVTATPIERMERNGKPVLFAAGGQRLGTFDLVVDALGARSPLAAGRARRTALKFGALWITVPWPQDGAFAHDALEQRYRRSSEMAGVLPLGRCAEGEPQQAAFFWSLRRDRVASWRERDLSSWKNDVAALWPQAAALLDGVVAHEQVTFAQYDHFTLAEPYSAGLVHVGDAAHATSPQLGQGANMALLDALALSRALGSHAELADALRAYARLRFWHVRLFQWASAIFTPFYQSDSRTLPFVRDWLAAPISRLPVADTLLARLVSGMTRPPLSGEAFVPLRVRLAPDDGPRSMLRHSGSVVSDTSRE